MRKTQADYIKKYHQSPKGKSALRKAIEGYFGTDKGRRARSLAVQRHNLRKKGLPATLTVDEWEETLSDFGHKCAYCEAGGEMFREHFIPVSKGGEFSRRNIVPACRTCNCRKSNIDPMAWLSREQYNRIAAYLNQR